MQDCFLLHIIISSHTIKRTKPLFFVIFFEFPNQFVNNYWMVGTFGRDIKRVLNQPRPGQKHGYTIPNCKQSYWFIAKKAGGKADPKASAIISSGNIFRSLAAHGKTPLGGAGIWMWRLQWNEVNCKLVPRKPWVTTSSKITLQKGKPVKFTWAI